MPARLDAPKLHRRSRGRMVGGVAGGIADHLRVPAAAVRVAFAFAALAAGFGVVLYAVFWIVLPAAPGRAGAVELTAAEYVAAGVVLVVALAASVLVAPSGSLFGPAALGCLGAAILWRQAGTGDRERWRRLSRTSLTAGAGDGRGRARVVVGAGLVVFGCAAVLATANLAVLRDGLVAVVVTLVGVALITGPWWVRMVTDLSDERRERIRSQERADLAAHLHDSVLQTLALIQRNASSPREVARLARGQERELRTLLYPEGEGSAAGPDGSPRQLGEAIRAAAAEVEDAYGVAVEVVVVGDVDLDDRITALVGAVREALVNAARHGSVDTVAVFVEVEEAAVVAYVRDRGVGFDPATVPPDRQGVQGSIVGRVERHGGRAEVRSTLGAGTEVIVRMAR